MQSQDASIFRVKLVVVTSRAAWPYQYEEVFSTPNITARGTQVVDWSAALFNVTSSAAPGNSTCPDVGWMLECVHGTRPNYENTCYINYKYEELAKCGTTSTATVITSNISTNCTCSDCEGISNKINLEEGGRVGHWPAPDSFNVSYTAVSKVRQMHARQRDCNLTAQLAA